MKRMTGIISKNFISYAVPIKQLAMEFKKYCFSPIRLDKTVFEVESKNFFYDDKVRKWVKLV